MVRPMTQLLVQLLTSNSSEKQPYLRDTKFEYSGWSHRCQECKLSKTSGSGYVQEPDFKGYPERAAAYQVVTSGAQGISLDGAG